MAYTLKQLSMAWTAVHGGIAPDADTVFQLQLRTNASFGDSDALAYVLNSADSSTALAALSYQFFTGKSPTQAGMAFLTNSADNPNDLNDAYYAKFNIENRYINFAANLGVVGEGKDAFAGKYGAMSFAAYVASIYETIIGSSYATAAGLDPAKAIADIVGRQDAILATARAAGMITPNMTQAQIDLAVKAATAGYLMGEAIKADVGLYAAAANNFMLALAKGEAVYNTDLTTTYKPVPGQGLGHAVPVAPPADTLPGLPPPPQPEPEPEPEPDPHAFTAGANTITGSGQDDSFTATDTTLDAGDTLNGGGGNDTLTLTVNVSPYTLPTPTVSGIETLVINASGSLTANTTSWTGLTQLTATAGGAVDITAAATTDITVTTTSPSSVTASLDGGRDISFTAAGDLVLDRTHAGTSASTVQVTGGASIDVTLTAANAVNTTQASGDVTLDGSSLTTSVKFKGSQTITADSSTAGHGGDNVVIHDAANTITTVEVDGYRTLSFDGGSLTTLKASHGGDIDITGGASTYGAMLSGVTGDFEDDDVNSLTLTRGADASAISLLVSNLTNLTIDGGGALTVGYWNSPILDTITVTGSGAFDAGDISGLFSLQEIDGAGATGAITATVNTVGVVVTTGSGADKITLTGTYGAEDITLGAGDDTLVLPTGFSLMAGTASGGSGTADTFSIDSSDAFAPGPTLRFNVNGFERLLIRGGGAIMVDVDDLGSYTYVISDAGVGLTINGLASGDTLQFQGAGTGTGVSGFGGANDTLNVVLTSAGGQTYGDLLGSVVENLIVSVVDTATSTGAHTWQAQSTVLKTVTVTGNADLNLTLDSTVLTSVDASGMTGGGLTLTTGALGQAATIKGSASHDNTVDFSATTDVVTYTGGSGDDLITGTNGQNNTVSLGAGDNSYTGGSGAETITLGGGGSTVDVGTGVDTVNVTGAAATSNTDFTTITGLGSGDFLKITAQGGAAEANGPLGAAVTVGGSPTLQDYLNAAAAGDGHTTAQVKWFQFGTDTYVVLDSHADAAFHAGVDIVVKLTGLTDLGPLSVTNGSIWL